MCTLTSPWSDNKKSCQSSLKAHHLCGLVSDTSWMCNFLPHMETLQCFWPRCWFLKLMYCHFPRSFYFSAQQGKKTTKKWLRVSPSSWDIYCKYCWLSTPCLPPAVANHRGRPCSVPPLSSGRFTFAQVLLSNRHQMSFLMEGKADRQLTPSWLFLF